MVSTKKERKEERNESQPVRHSVTQSQLPVWCAKTRGGRGEKRPFFLCLSLCLAGFDLEEDEAVPVICALRALRCVQRQLGELVLVMEFEPCPPLGRPVWVLGSGFWLPAH